MTCDPFARGYMGANARSILPPAVSPLARLRRAPKAPRFLASPGATALTRLVCAPPNSSG